MTQHSRAGDDWQGEPGQIGGSAYAPPNPEEAAMHLEHDRRPARDPGRSDESAEVDDGDDGPVSYFDDEQPERAVTGRPDEHEPDLEELLETQHYAFAAPEPDDEGPAAT